MNQVADFAASLHLGAKALQFYSAEHPRSQEAISAVERTCAAMLADRARVTLTATKGALLVDHEPMPTNNLHIKALASELEKRQIGGLTIVSGVTRQELTETLRLLVLRPEQLRDLGGAEKFLDEANVAHVRISRVRYEAITEGEEVVWSATVRYTDPAEQAEEADALPVLLQRYLLAKIGDANAGAPPVDYAASGELAEALGKALATGESADGDETGGFGTAAAPNTRARQLLRSAMNGLDPLAQLALLASLDRLPEGAPRAALKTAALDILNLVSTEAGNEGGSGTGSGDRVNEGDAIASLIRSLNSTDGSLDLLRGRLAELSVSREQLDELLDVLAWDKLTVEEKMEKLLAGDRIFDFPPDKVFRFLRELFESGRQPEALRILDRLARGLEHDSLVIRRGVCDLLGQTTTLMKRQIVGRDAEALLGRAVLNHFVREREPRMRNALGDAAASLLTAFVAQGRSDTALRVLTALESATTSSPADAAVRQAFDSLHRSLAEPRRVAEILGQVMNADAETLTRSVLPLVVQLGDVLAPHIIDALGNEEDRNKRGRLVKAIKAIGEPAFPFLVETVSSPTWYVARNALNVLGDIGTKEHVAAIGRQLEHSDPRVRRAAARALGKIGGEDAEGLLVKAIGDRDAETQSEVLVALGAMRAQGAVAGVGELAKTRLMGGDDKLRELALATLGQIGSDAAVPLLRDILRPKGLFSRDPASVRLAAGKALAMIATPAAAEALKSAAASESDRAMKEALAKLAVS